MGKTEARLFTPPLRELTPETSYGFDVIIFARDVLQQPLDPWEEFSVIHAGELLPDGRPRFRKVLILVARQNGKTHLLRILTLYWLFVEEWEMLLGVSSDRNYARKQWLKVCDQAKMTPALRELLPQRQNLGVCTRNGDENLTTAAGSEYRIAAPNSRAGRSLSIDRLIADEIREHRDWDTWDAAYNAMNARSHAQAFCITNQGDDRSVVLNSLRDSALDYINSGQGDDRLGLLEWSAPDGLSVDDPEGLAAANPNLGRRLLLEDLMSEARRIKGKPKEEAKYRTEVLCQRVRALDAAVDAGAWKECGDVAPMPRDRVAMCVDISPDNMHGSLAVATVLPDDRVRVEVVADWTGFDALRELRADLPQWIDRVKPKALGWFPNGPAAALAADLAERKGRHVWPPRGVTVSEIRTEVSAVCMGFSEMVKMRQVAHSDQAGLTAHVTGAAKLHSGETWRFARKEQGHCDAAYAAAGAVHLARTMPVSVGKPRLVVVESA